MNNRLRSKIQMKIDDCSHLYEKGFPLAYFLIPSISKQIMRKLQCKAIYMYTNKWVFISLLQPHTFTFFLNSFNHYNEKSLLY